MRHTTRSFRAVAACALALVGLLLAPSLAMAENIFIDPGHGGPYSNANIPSLGIYEKNLNLFIALALRQELEAAGHTVAMSRTDDRAVGTVDIPTWNYTSTTDRWAYAADGTTRYSSGVPRDDLQARCNLANAFGADVFISIHNNGSTSPIPDGTETFASDEDLLGIELSRRVHANILAETGLDDRGAKFTDFYVIKWSHMPSILVEGAFITNPADRALLTSVNGQRKIARGIARGVTEFLDAKPFKPVWGRIAGDDRYETAAAVSAAGWPSGASTVLLATGVDWPDALASAPLSRKLDAPLLLASGGGLPASTAAEIARLAPSEIVVLGGRGAVSDSVVASAAAAASLAPANTRRIAGVDRFATAAAIAREVGVADDGRVAVVSGWTAADAVSIAPYAARNEIPILLTTPSRLPGAAQAVLEDFGAAWDSTLVVGGSCVVSAELERELPRVTRIAGADRYETNVAVVEQLYTADRLGFYVSNGQAFPDNLTAAALGGKTGRASLLVKPRALPDRLRLYIENNESRIQAWTMVGGSTVLPYLHDWMLRKALN